MKQVFRNKDEGPMLERYKKSFFHAIDGIIYCICYEHNMIIILVATFCTILAGILLHIHLFEWLFCFIIIGGIMATELINSSIEALVDLSSPKKHPLAKIAKDTASGATLVLCFIALIGGILIFLPKIIKLF